MKPYSNDLRCRLVAAYETQTYSQSKVAELFGVSVATVKNLLRRHWETGSPDALPHAGGKQPLLDDKARVFIQALLQQDNDLTLEELCQRVARAYQKRVSRPTMGRVLQALGLPRKKSRSTPLNVTPPESNRRVPLTAKR